jgi:hypothetical protein
MGRSRRVLRWEIPVDDEWHAVVHAGGVVHVGSRDAGTVEFWTTDDVAVSRFSDGTGRVTSVHYRELTRPENRTWYRVYGTGEKVDGLYVGTTYDGSDSRLVWHLFKYESPDRPEELT